MDSPDASDASLVDVIMTLARGTPGFLITRDKHNSQNKVFYDAVLHCSGNASFHLELKNQINFPDRSKKRNCTPSEGRWGLSNVAGLSLGSDASIIIEEIYNNSLANRDEITAQYISDCAIGLTFNLAQNHIPGMVVEGQDRTTQLSFILYNPDDVGVWIDGLGFIAQNNNLDMNVDAVEEEFNALDLDDNTVLQSHPIDSIPSANVTKNGRRLSKTAWTAEDRLAEESDNKKGRKTLRKTRFTICPTNDNDVDSPSASSTRSAGTGARRSVFGSSSAMVQSNSVQSEQQMREKEFEFQSKLEQMERKHAQEAQELRNRLERTKNEVNQVKAEMQTLGENHEIELSTQEEEFQERLEQLEKEYQSSITQLKEKYDDLINDLNVTNESNIALSNEVVMLRDEMTRDMDLAQEKYQNNFENLISELNSFKKQTEKELEGLQKIVTNLFNDKKKLINALIESQGNIRVFVRVRPVLPHEVEQSKAAGMKDIKENGPKPVPGSPEYGKDLVCVDVINQLDLFNAGQMGGGDGSPMNRLAAITQPKDDIETLLNSSLGAYKVKISDPEKTNGTGSNEYAFEHVFDRTASQAQIVEQVLPFVTSVADGYNCCLFAYGQTGSGKTYTMEGTDTEMGVNYTALTALFNLLAERKIQMAKSGVEHQFSVEISAVEIYNDDVKDLFTNSPVTVQFIDNKANMKELSSRAVSSCDEIRHQLRTKAYVNRTTAATKMNAVSSRSHSLIFVNIKSVYTVPECPSQSEIVTSRLVLIDLAGSERVARSGVEGKMFNEAVNINKSLSTLGLCLSSLQKQDKHIPFRDSKLTMVLADCLTGDSKVLMFANVSPASINAGESNSTLQFALRASKTGLGKASKNTTASTGSVGVVRGNVGMIGHGNGSNNGVKEKREDEMKIKGLESEKNNLLQQLHQLQIQLQNTKQSHQQQVEMMKEEAHGLENKLEKEKEKNRVAMLEKTKQAMTTPMVEKSKQRLSAHLKSTPNKRISTSHKLSLIPTTVNEEGVTALPPVTPVIDSIGDESGQNGQNDDMVQLPAPSISGLEMLMESTMHDFPSQSSSSRRNSKRKSTDMMFDDAYNDGSIHLNKQQRHAMSSSALPSVISSSAASTPARPPVSRNPGTNTPAITSSSRPTLSSSTVRTTVSASSSRPTISSTSPTATGTGTSRPTMSGAVGTASKVTQPSSKMVSSSSTTTSRPTISSNPSSSRPLAPAGASNRPTISAAGPRPTISAVAGAGGVKKNVVPTAISRPTISATATGAAVTQRKTVSAVGVGSAVKKPIAK